MLTAIDEFCCLDVAKSQSFLKMWKMEIMKKIVVNNSLSNLIGDGTPPLKVSNIHTLEARFVLFPEQKGSRFENYVWPKSTTNIRDLFIVKYGNI